MGSWLDKMARGVRSKAGDMWDRGFETGRGAVKATSEVLGGAKDLAEAPFTDDEYDGFLGTIYDVATKRAAAAAGDLLGPNEGVGAAIGGLPEQVRDPAGKVFHGVTDTSERIYHDVVARPISTAMRAASLASRDGASTVIPIDLAGDKIRIRWGRPQDLLKGDTWREAWKWSDEHSDPGQAIALAIGTKDVTDPKEVERFVATDAYKRMSGIADALLRYNLDPLVVAGKFKTGLAEGFKAVPEGQEAIQAATQGSRVTKFVDRVDEIVAKDGKGAAGRIRTEMFPDTAEGAYYADLLAQAPDTLARRKVVGSLMGSASDYMELTANAPGLAHQIRNLSSDAFDAFQAERGLVGPGRAEMLDAELNSLYPELDRLTKLEATFGTMSEIPKASTLSQLRAGISTSDFYQHNPLTAPVRVATNMLPHHWVNLNDQRSDIQVSRLLEQSSLPAERRLALRGEYMAQVGPAARQRSMAAIEAEIVNHTLEKYGVPKWIVDDVLDNAAKLRGEAQSVLRRAKYDAEGRGTITIPHADGVERVAMPLHVTQQADLYPMVNVKALEQAAQAVQGWNWDAGIWDSVRNKYQGMKLGASNTTAAKTAATVSHLPTEALEGFYALWRPATLLRAGWPVRVLGDNQLRIMAKIGAAAQLGKLAEGGVNRVKQRLTPWEFTTTDGELIAGRGLPSYAKASPEQIAEGIVRRGTGEWETTIKARSGQEYTLAPAFGTPGDAAQAMKRLNSGSSTFREVVVSDEPALLRSYREGTGQWKTITAETPEAHAPAWEGAVNRQIRNSEFARQFLAGSSVEDGVAWLAKTDEGIAYAREMGWSPKTFESHADDVYDQVHRYVPTEGLRSTLLERELGYEDLKRAVPGDRLPSVHGEDVAQALGKSDTFKILRNTRDQLFKFLGTLPDEVLSRNPYFDAMYQQEAERLVNLADDAARQAGRVLDEKDLTRIAGQSRRYALNESKKLLYDLSEKSELAHMLRFVSPFFMAWEEVATRWAGIAVENPAFVARMRLAWDSPEKMGLVTDEHGAVVNGYGQAVDPLTGEHREPGSDRYINLPFSIPGMPKSGGKVRFNKKSLNVALAGVPGAGPPTQVLVNELVKNRPDLEKSVRFILPYGSSQSSISMLLPPGPRQIYSSAQGEDDRIYRNNLLRIMGDRMTDYMLGKRKDKPTYGEVKKAADHLSMLTLVAKYVSPVTPIFDSPYQPYINAYRNAQERLRKNPKAFGVHADGSPKGADEWFLDSFGEEYFWLTQSLSKSNDGVQPTIEGFEARKKYQDLIEEHPDLGGLIIGNEGQGEFSSGVYGSQLARDTKPGSGVKQRGSFAFNEYAEAPEVRLGWIKYGQAMDVIETERVKRGLPNLQVKAALDLKIYKQLITDALTKKYEAWGEAFAQQDTQAWDKRITAFRQIATDPRLTDRGDRPDIKGLSEYLTARDAFVAELSKRKAKTITAASNQDLALLWDTVKSAIVEKNVAFAPVFFRYLERDPLTVEKP